MSNAQSLWLVVYYLLMKNILLIAQITISIVLIFAILLQTKGTGLGSTFGQSQETFRTKRGMEKILHSGTIILIILFLILSLSLVLIK
jgi:protein translocase SecG subunit